MGTIWRCPRCGAVAVMDPQYGGELIAVYDLCLTEDAARGSRIPVRMERVLDASEWAPAKGQGERVTEKVLVG